MVIFTLFLFAPLTLYFTNILEYSLLLSKIWYIMVLISLAGTVLLTGILTILKQSILRKMVSILFVLGVLFWLQGNIFVWDFGVLDGTEINWKDHRTVSVFEIALWLLLLVFALIKTDTISKISRFGSICILGIQCVSIVFLGINSSDEPEWKKNEITQEGKFEYSNQKNVVILVLDSFQSDIFQEIINEDPKIKSDFEGFTYFRNSLAGFPTTYASVPLILTGQYYDNSIPIQKFIDNAYRSNSLPAILKKYNYQVELYPFVRNTISINETIASNTKEVDLNSQLSQLPNLYHSSFFKYMPVIFKKYFYEKQEITNIHDSDLLFMEGVNKQTKTALKNDTFKFFHIAGAHAPYKLNENLEEVDLSINRTGYKTQAKAAVTITRNYLNSLKHVGVFDQSMIIIVGDHGSGRGINTLSLDNIKIADYEVTNSSLEGSGVPLILVKPFGETKELTISDAPVTLGDVTKTILDELDIHEEVPGMPMFKVKVDEDRKRSFYLYQWSQEYWDNEYLPVMDEYLVTGHSWFQQSWSKSFTKLLPGSAISTLGAYQYGMNIDFGSKGNSEEYKNTGWWTSSENSFTWTVGPAASLDMRIATPKTDLNLITNFQPFITNTIKEQKVNVKINGIKIGEWHAKETGNYELSIPKKMITSTHLKITFEMPNAASPAMFNISDDNRNLGIAMVSLRISEKSQ
jgi:Phosphoglycerol transferase and related proteins, alkaline phosphatase superfamily